MLGWVTLLVTVVSVGIILALEPCTPGQHRFEAVSNLQGLIFTHGVLASGSVDSRSTCVARCLQLPACLSAVFVPTSVPNCRLLDKIYSLYDVTSGNVTTLEEPSATYLRGFGTVTECKGQAVDVAFLVDASGSVGTANFPKVLDFVVQLLSRFRLGPQDAQVAVVSFDTQVYPRVSLNNFTEVSPLSATVMAIPFTAGGTYTSLGLDHLRTATFQAAHGARVGAKRVAVVLTDGVSNNATLTASAAAGLRGANVTVLAVGIGSGVNSAELTAIASPGQVFMVGNFTMLSGIVEAVAASSCPSH